MTTTELGARSLARRATGGLALNVTNTVATVLTTIVLARLMSLESFGTYSWMVATVYLLTVPAMLGVDRLLVREVSVYLGRGDHGHVRGLLRRSFQLVLTACAAIVAVVAIVLLMAGPVVDPTTAATLAIGSLALPALGLAWVAQAGLMGMHHVVVGQTPELFLRPVLLLGFVAVAAIAVSGPLGAPLAAALFTGSAGVAAVVALVLLRRRVAASISPDTPIFESRQWLAGALGLVVLSGALFINSQIGTVLLGLLDEASSAGLYAVAQRGALLVAFPLLALNAAIAPTAARLWANGDVGQLQRLATLGARGVFVCSLPIAIAFIVAGEPLVTLVFGNAFSGSALPLAILTLGQLVNAATGSVATLLMMTGEQRRAVVGIGVGLALNLGLGIALIPGYGATGAAIAAAIGLVAANLIHTVMSGHSLGIDPTVIGLRLRAARTASPAVLGGGPAE